MYQLDTSQFFIILYVFVFHYNHMQQDVMNITHHQQELLAVQITHVHIRYYPIALTSLMFHILGRKLRRLNLRNLKLKIGNLLWTFVFYSIGSMSQKILFYFENERDVITRHYICFLLIYSAMMCFLTNDSSTNRHNDV